MLRTKFAILGAALAIVAAPVSNAAVAAEGVDIPEQHWPWAGIFGGFDQAQLQRGYQVYESVCASCHSMNLVAFRNLHDLGFNDDQIDLIAANRMVSDIDQETGQPITRPGMAADYFPAPFPNEIAARFSNAGALPPDLSVIAKARLGEADYLYAVLTGYHDAPTDVDVPVGKYFNEYFPGNIISMAPPLYENAVTYVDGTTASVDQMARDVSAFLMWAAEPSMIERKELGVKVILFLIVLAGIAYAVKRKIWSDVEH